MSHFFIHLVPLTSQGVAAPDLKAEFGSQYESLPEIMNTFISEVFACFYDLLFTFDLNTFHFAFKESSQNTQE
jgi:hypothetical protein